MRRQAAAVLYQTLPSYADATTHMTEAPKNQTSLLYSSSNERVFLTGSHVNKLAGTQGHFIPTLSLLETTRQGQ